MGLPDDRGERADEDYWGYRGRSHQELASLGARFVGAMVDGFLVLLAVVPGYALIIATADSQDETLALLGVALLFGSLLLLAVVQLVLLSMHGQTLGKKVAGTRIVNVRDGSNPGFVGAVLLRNVVPGMIGSLPCVGPIFSLADILYIFGEDRRCLHDHIAGTRVVNA
jgi:uncharacterized RDD family membrane protein YckC